MLCVHACRRREEWRTHTRSTAQCWTCVILYGKTVPSVPNADLTQHFSSNCPSKTFLDCFSCISKVQLPQGLLYNYGLESADVCVCDLTPVCIHAESS